MITCHSREIENILLLFLYYYHMKYITIIRNGTLDLDLVRHSSEVRIALVPPVSIEYRLLLWMIVRSQTYYHEHILAYGCGKARYVLVVGSSSFRTD